MYLNGNCYITILRTDSSGFIIMVLIVLNFGRNKNTRRWNIITSKNLKYENIFHLSVTSRHKNITLAKPLIQFQDLMRGGSPPNSLAKFGRGKEKV